MKNNIIYCLIFFAITMYSCSLDDLANTQTESTAQEFSIDNSKNSNKAKTGTNSNVTKTSGNRILEDNEIHLDDNILIDDDFEILNDDDSSSLFSCKDILDTSGNSIHYFYVEFEISSTHREKRKVRNKYCPNLISVTPCTNNPKGEIWVIRGNCPQGYQCKPDVVKPIDPILTVAKFSSVCDL